MKEDLNKNETMGLTMHYYAYLNDQDVVETIVSLPSTISDPKYIAISTNDQSLIGKKYNRQTGEFEDIMFYYAILDEKDIVIEVVALESMVTDEKKIEISTYDQSLVGKWYDRKNKIFCAPPIHVLAKLNSGQINTLKADGSPEDKWLHTELAELRTQISEKDNVFYTELGKLRTQISEVERGNFGGYKTKFKLRDNQEITSGWVDNGKRLTFNFDSGISGYFPKMIRLVEEFNGDRFVADIYIVRNPDGTVKRSYVDADYIGNLSSEANTLKRQLYHDKDADRYNVFEVGYDRGKYYNQGAQYFVQRLDHLSAGQVEIGKFSYNENSISFTIMPSSEMVGIYTAISLRGYVY
ncbi:MAG: hypothetical protein VB095_00510 [Anaerovorax sp.]|nr:hypothetical protein [Anaerovorax sp.]